VVVSDTDRANRYTKRVSLNQHIQDLFRSLTVEIDPKIHVETLRLVYGYLVSSFWDQGIIHSFMDSIQILLTELGLPLQEN